MALIFEFALTPSEPISYKWLDGYRVINYGRTDPSYKQNKYFDYTKVKAAVKSFGKLSIKAPVWNQEKPADLKEVVFDCYMYDPK